MGERFDWNEDESVVVREQPPIAVYINPHNQIVIRQDDYGDKIIRLNRESVPKFIQAILQQTAVLDDDTEGPVALRTPAPLSPAERQRRHREKLKRERDAQRDEERDSPVTEELQFSLLAAE